MNGVCVFGMHVLKTDVWNQKPEIHVSVHSYIILYYGEERQGVQSDIWPAGIFYIYLMEQACWEWPLPRATRQRLDTASCTPDSQVILLPLQGNRTGATIPAHHTNVRISLPPLSSTKPSTRNIEGTKNRESMDFSDCQLSGCRQLLGIVLLSKSV